MSLFPLDSQEFTWVEDQPWPLQGPLGCRSPPPPTPHSTARYSAPGSMWPGRGPAHLTEEEGRARLGQDLPGLGASRERRSTNSSKLHIDFCPVVGSPGTSRNGIGFQLEKWKGRLSLGQEGKVRRRDTRAAVPQRYQGLDRGSGEVVPPLYLPSGMRVSRRWPRS